MFGVDPLLRGQLGRAFLLLGFGFALLAALIWTGYYFRVRDAAASRGTTPEACGAIARTLGGEPTAEGATLTVVWRGVDGGLETLGRASQAAVACAGWVMESFCMGQQCEVPGARLVLRRR